MRLGWLPIFAFCACLEPLSAIPPGADTEGPEASGPNARPGDAPADAPTPDDDGQNVPEVLSPRGAEPPFSLEHPAAITVVEVSNDQGFSRDAFAYSAIPLSESVGLTRVENLTLIDRDTDEILVAQGVPLSRYGGPPDSDGPIRWLGVSARVALAPGARRVFEVVVADEEPSPDNRLSVSQSGDLITVDTGAAQFSVDASQPALLLDGRRATGRFLGGAAGGPTITLEDGTVLEASSVQVDSYEVTERGPVRFEIMQKGHLIGAGTRCDTGDFESLGYTTILRLYAHSADIDLELHVRNECSDAFNGPFTDQARTVREAGFELVVPMADPGLRYATNTQFAHASEAPLYVEQTKGAGDPWQRQALVRAGETVLVAANSFRQPAIAVTGTEATLVAQMPWMRFREPQATAYRDGKLAFLLISRPLVFGEARGIWGHARVSVVADDAPLEAALLASTADLERGLLVRALRGAFDASGLFPSLGTDAPSQLKTEYENALHLLHEGTVREGGQWEQSKTYGSQLWPDTQFDQYGATHANPNESRAWMNYWNPAGAELWEFLRTGDPKWAWDMGLPSAWLQMYSAYLNLGDHEQGNQNGFAISSGGAGEGQWHRAREGSSDYSYNRGQHPAYVIRPSPALRDRFAQAGRTTVNRYNYGKADESRREQWVNQIVPSRQAFQHFEMLANCAEFVPGTTGARCRQKLDEIVEELVEDNLRGTLCSSDVPTDVCTTPQQFMINAMMYGLLMRYHRSFEERDGRLRTALVQLARTYYERGLTTDESGSIDVTAPFAARLSCAIVEGGTADCAPAPDSDGNVSVYGATKPHTLGVLLQSAGLDPKAELCSPVRAAFEDERLYSGFRGWVPNEAGYWKGINQALQDLVFAVGAVDRCGP